MSQDVGDLLRLQPVVERDCYQPSLKAGEEEGYHLQRVAPMDGDAVSGLQSFLQKPEGEGIG